MDFCATLDDVFVEEERAEIRILVQRAMLGSSQANRQRALLALSQKYPSIRRGYMGDNIIFIRVEEEGYKGPVIVADLPRKFINQPDWIHYFNQNL